MSADAARSALPPVVPVAVCDPAVAVPAGPQDVVPAPPAPAAEPETEVVARGLVELAEVAPSVDPVAAAAAAVVVADDPAAAVAVAVVVDPERAVVVRTVAVVAVACAPVPVSVTGVVEEQVEPPAATGTAVEISAAEAAPAAVSPARAAAHKAWRTTRPP
jgi:hypothetical protein